MTETRCRAYLFIPFGDLPLAMLLQKTAARAAAARVRGINVDGQAANERDAQ